MSRILAIFSAVWLASVPWIWSSSSRVGGGLGLGTLVGVGQHGVDALLDDPLGLGHQRGDHLRLRHDPHDLALHEQVALALARRRSRGRPRAPHPDRSRRSPSPPPAAGCCGRSSASCASLATRITSTSARPQLGHAMRSSPLRSRRPSASSSVRPARASSTGIGGEREADRVADALGEQRADPGDRLHEPVRRRPGLGDAEVQRVVDGLGEHAGTRRSSTARSTP